MISKVRHNEPEYNGKPIFIVHTKEGISRKVLGVPFVEGIGKLTDPLRARQFDEWLEYEVTLPVDYPVWEKAQPEGVVTDDFDEVGNDYFPVSDEPW